ncbi:MAG TPA: hypothetical protein VE992_04335 [Solirubrobacteraceae bacterium]|nr:hypothetical protein [Solirubrobacteraceae bacterium]
MAALLSAARAHDRAPASLRARVERERIAARPVRRRARAYGLATALAAAVAIVLVINFALPGGSPGAPTISQAAALAGRGQVWPPPAPDPDNATARLNAKVGPVYFPNWRGRVGWWATGERRDRLAGRSAITVYYTNGSDRVAYTIVAVSSLRGLNATPHRVGTVWVRALRLGGRAVVTWRQAGQSCVLSSATMSATALARLAAVEAPRGS